MKIETGGLFQVYRLDAAHASRHGVEHYLCRLLLTEEVAAERLHEAELSHRGLVGSHGGVTRGERCLNLGRQARAKADVSLVFLFFSAGSAIGSVAVCSSTMVNS